MNFKLNSNIGKMTYNLLVNLPDQYTQTIRS